MKLTGIIVCLLIAYSGYSQTDLEKKFSKISCNCIDSLAAKNSLTQETLFYCFENSLQANRKLVELESQRIYGDTSEESGHKIGADLAQKAMLNLVSSCRTYFYFMDSLRYEDYKNLNPDSLTLVFNEMSKAGIENQSEKFLEKRALLSFHLKKYQSSLTDIEAVLKLNPENGQSIFLKGWINEISGDYDAAKAMYDRVANITKNSSFLIFSEIAKRKKKEKG
ncbi:MAG: hypothetical protein ABIP35_02815 [Ginsengibacter sp.]